MESSPPRKDDEEREAEDQEDSGEGEENEWGDFASYAQLDEEEDDGNDDDMGAVCAPESKDELAEREEYQSAHDNSEEIDDASGAAGYDESAAAERGPSEELAARMVDMKMQRLERDYAATISSVGTQREQEERAERLRETEAEILAELERSAAAGAAAMHSAPVPTEDEDIFDPFEENQRRPEQSPYRPISPLRPEEADRIRAAMAQVTFPPPTGSRAVHLERVVSAAQRQGRAILEQQARARKVADDVA